MSRKTNALIQADMDVLLPNHSMERIFDVGANVGQTSTALRSLYPDAAITAFEPVPASYALLVDAVDGLDVETHNLGLSAIDGEAAMTDKGSSVNNRLVAAPGPETQPVKLARGDTFCQERGITRLSYLKIDTEGHELSVLRGFASMLTTGGVEVIELEAGVSPNNRKHTPLRQLLGLLEPLGFSVLRFYEQIAEKRSPVLRRVNVVLVSDATVQANPRVR